MDAKELTTAYNNLMRTNTTTVDRRSYEEDVELLYKHALEQESCEGCISREEALKVLRADPSFICTGDKTQAITDISSLPPVTPERPKGKWIVEESEFNIKVKCSCCNYMVNYFWSGWNEANYCPNCGARMESEG